MSTYQLTVRSHDALRQWVLDEWTLLVAIASVSALPETMDEFKEQLAKAQVFMTVPDRYTKVQFVEQHLDTIVVRLPPAVAIADSEEKLSKPGATYPLPPFYKRLFNGIDPVIPEADKFKVHAERIGDYTISFCA